MKCKQLLLLAGLGLFSSPLFADMPGNYWGVSYIDLDFSTENPVDEYRNGVAVLDAFGNQVTGSSVKGNEGLSFRFGREITQYMAIEVHLGITQDSNSNLIGTKADINYGAAFFRLNAPYRNFNFYVMGGASQVNFDFGTRVPGPPEQGTRVDGDESGAAGAIGMDFFGSENGALTIEFSRLGVDNTSDIITIGYKHHFSFAPFR